MTIAKIALSAIAFTIASGAAMAQEAVPAQWNEAYTPNVAVVPSGKTRADIVGEMLAARQSGELSRYDHDSYTPTGLIHSAPQVATGKAKPVSAPVAGLTREQVRAEFLAARRSGESNAFDSDPVASHGVAGVNYASVAPADLTVAAR